MRGYLLIILIIIISIGSFITGFFIKNYSINSPTIAEILPPPIENYMETYYVDKLNDIVKQGSFKITDELDKNSYFTSNLFELEFNPNPLKSEKKITTGVINVPINNTPAPLIILIRGYVDQKIFTSGMGTKRVSEYFAKNGYITIAPDFLGYGKSSPEADNIFETRFQTYTTIISLHKSVSQIPNWDGKNIFIWAHSNGGQIALTWIVAQSLDNPTVLWAPVTKPFPYSVLYYTDESEDGGKLIRRELAKLENNCDVDKFSFTTYFDRIRVPIQLHQGTNDDAIPLSWSSNFVNKLKSQSTEVQYFTYPEDNHNLSKNWETVVERSLSFYNNKLK